MTAYYNEIDPYAAAWLRNLIDAGYIAPGDVDDRSIEDVRPDDLRGYTQCHFFAGLGGWSYALRLAGWPDDRSIWTASCPCQPFSAAGKGNGFADERHLWPTQHHLVAEFRPAVIVGEQVASAAVDDWIDLVHADLEALGYAFGSVPFPSAGVGAPHIRERNYWVAHAPSIKSERRIAVAGAAGRRPEPGTGTARHGAALGLGHASGSGLDQRERIAGIPGIAPGARAGQAAVGTGIHLGGMADDSRGGRREECADAGGGAVGDRAEGRPAGLVDGGGDLRPGPTNGFWRDADWLGCRDDRWRPVEPGTFPLAHGAASAVGRVRADQERLAALVPRKDQDSRVGRLRAYGNAINVQAARAWIETVMECLP